MWDREGKVSLMEIKICKRFLKFWVNRNKIFNYEKEN